MALTWVDDLRQGEAMRGIARTVVLAATCDIADAPVDPARSSSQEAWAPRLTARDAHALARLAGVGRVVTVGGAADGSGGVPLRVPCPSEG